MQECLDIDKDDKITVKDIKEIFKYFKDRREKDAQNEKNMLSDDVY
jgi:hypothetical protein